LSIKPEKEENKKQGYYSRNYFITQMKMMDVITFARKIQPQCNFMQNKCRYYTQCLVDKLKKETKTISLPFAPEYMDAYYRKFPRQQCLLDGKLQDKATVGYLSFSKLVQRFPRESLDKASDENGIRPLEKIFKALAYFREEKEYKEQLDVLLEEKIPVELDKFIPKAKESLEIMKVIQKNGQKNSDQEKVLEQIESYITTLETYLSQQTVTASIKK